MMRTWGETPALVGGADCRQESERGTGKNYPPSPACWKTSSTNGTREAISSAPPQYCHPMISWQIVAKRGPISGRPNANRKSPNALQEATKGQGIKAEMWGTAI